MADKDIKKISVTTLEKKIADLEAENKKLKESNQKWVSTEKDWIKKDFLEKKGIEEKFERFYELKKKQAELNLSDEEINWNSFFKEAAENKQAEADNKFVPKTPYFSSNSNQTPTQPTTKKSIRWDKHKIPGLTKKLEKYTKFKNEPKSDDDGKISSEDI